METFCRYFKNNQTQKDDINELAFFGLMWQRKLNFPVQLFESPYITTNFQLGTI